MSKEGGTVSQHIRDLWSDLSRRVEVDTDSLLALPHPYISPGGIFDEQFYWDSYFIMLGLAADGKWSMAEGMVKNFAYLIDTYGFIPTGNHTVYLTRSQPPFFSHMVRLLARHKGRAALVDYLPYLEKEYRFWMRGKSKLAQTEHRAYRHLIQMPNGSFLNRYYDHNTKPRPEMLEGDKDAAARASQRQSDRLFLHLRAATESGWDFSSRWLLGSSDMATIHTADIIPVDLNSLLHHLEGTIAESYRLKKDAVAAHRYQLAADRRAGAILHYCWDESRQFFGDYNFHHGTMTGHITLAGVFPLFGRIATPRQAAAVAHRLQQDFLKPGGLVTSLVETGQQWDAPNGWAPLQYVAIQGLRNYGYHRLANEIKARWVKANLLTFYANGKLVEKYNVIDPHQPAGGGEYPLQEGFGWTNGVLAALLAE